MSALLYISISSKFTDDELKQIDKQVYKNYEPIKSLTLNGKRKVKRLFVHGILLFQLSQPLVLYAAAIMILLPPAIERLSFFEQDRILSNKNGYPQVAIIPELKVDKIRLTNEQIKEFNNLAIELNSGSITMEEAVLRLRGGDGLTDVVAVIAFVIFINWYDSLFGVEAFQANPLPHVRLVEW